MSLSYVAVGEAVAPGALAEAVGWSTGAVGVGISAGTAAAGWILDAGSRWRVFAFAAALAVAALLTRLRPATPGAVTGPT